MKIDFLGRYDEIEQLIAVPRGASLRPEEGNSFAALLPAQRPEEIKIPTTSPSSSQPPSVTAPPPGDLMARYNFPEPDLVIPPSDSRVAPEAPVKQTSPPVKAPSLLDVRRIPPGAGLAALPREERIETVGKLIARAGERHGIDPALGMAVVEVESSFNPNAVSTDGHATKGLFQLKDTTGKGLLRQGPSTDAYEPLDPEMNVDLGVSYLRRLHNLFSARTELHERAATVGAANSSSLEKLAVAAFNAGEGRVAEAQRRAALAGKDPSLFEDVEPYLPETTRNYVRKVMTSKEAYAARTIG